MIFVDSLNELTDEQVSDAHDRIVQLVQELDPSIDAKRGVLHDLVLHLNAILSTAHREEIDRLRRSSTLQAIDGDPDLADDDIVDALFSNFGITRRSGSAASGEVTVVLSSQQAVTIPSGAILEASGQQFTTEAAFAARLSASDVQSDADRVLQPLGDGTYAFTIDVVATEAGDAGAVQQGDQLTLSPPPPAFLRAYAASDFSGGTDTETNADLRARQQEGVAAKTLGGRTNIRSLIRAQDAFADVMAISLVGFGDPEMLRDQHTLWPGSVGGGRVDAYVRSQSLTQSISVEVQATLVDKRADGSVWQFSLERDDAPGFYQILKVLRPSDAADASGFAVESLTRGKDLSGDAFVPDIETDEEAAYSRYQTGVVQFLDTQTDVSSTDLMTTASYVAVVQRMPLVADLQEFLGGRDIRNPGGDILVKAAIPCLLSLSFTVRRWPDAADYDEDEIKNSLAETVNALGFPGQLHASLLSDTIHDHLDDRAAVSSVEMLGKILRPDGTFRRIYDKEILTIPDEPDRMVTGRTTAFILDPADIGIASHTVDTPPV